MASLPSSFNYLGAATFANLVKSADALLNITIGTSRAELEYNN
jgi:hypothetical protein